MTDDLTDIPARPPGGAVKSRSCRLLAAMKKVTGKPDGTVEVVLAASALDSLTAAYLIGLLPAEEVNVRLEAVQTELPLDHPEGE